MAIDRDVVVTKTASKEVKGKEQRKGKKNSEDEDGKKAAVKKQEEEVWWKREGGLCGGKGCRCVLVVMFGC